jgi:hypothetical protein
VARLFDYGGQTIKSLPTILCKLRLMAASPHCLSRATTHLPHQMRQGQRVYLAIIDGPNGFEFEPILHLGDRHFTKRQAKKK